MKPLAGTGRDPNGLEGKGKEREPPGVWRWKAAGVWCLGSGEWVGCTGKRAAVLIPPMVRLTTLFSRQQIQTVIAFYPSISAVWSR